MNIPFYITLSIIAVGALGAISLPIMLARAGKRAAIPVNITARFGLALGAWFFFTTVLAIAGGYRLVIGEIVPVLGIGLLVTLVAGGLAIAAYAPLRRLISDPAAQSAVIALQAWRIEGAAFLILMSLGQLPPLFALPAGLGDLFVGLTAPLMARNIHHPGSRRWAIAWNLFGLADLAVALTLGATTSPGPTQLFFTTPTSELITVFPLAIIPTFFVPLSILLHLVSLRYLFSTAARSNLNENLLVRAAG